MKDNAVLQLEQNLRLWSQTGVSLEMKVFQFASGQNVEKKPFYFLLRWNNATITQHTVLNLP